MPDDPIDLYDVFISYSHTDGAWVRDWLASRLKGAGLKVCTDRESFDIGVPVLMNMENAVAASRHTVIVLTPGYVASVWTQYEALLVQQHDPISLLQRTHPVLRDPCELPQRIAMLNYADLSGQADDVAEFAKLLDAINGVRRLPQIPHHPRRTNIKGIAESDSRSDASQLVDALRSFATQQHEIEELLVGDLRARVRELESKVHSIELEKQKVSLKLERTEDDLKESLAENQQIEPLRNQIRQLELKNQELKFKLGEMFRNQTISFWLILFGTLLISIGVNFVTNDINNWLGWALIVCGSALQIVAFLSKPKG